jgi:hypothetical protein
MVTAGEHGWIEQQCESSRPQASDRNLTCAQVRTRFPRARGLLDFLLEVSRHFRNSILIKLLASRAVMRA